MRENLCRERERDLANETDEMGEGFDNAMSKLNFLQTAGTPAVASDCCFELEAWGTSSLFLSLLQAHSPLPLYLLTQSWPNLFRHSVPPLGTFSLPCTVAGPEL